MGLEELIVSFTDPICDGLDDTIGIVGTLLALLIDSDFMDSVGLFISFFEALLP